MQVARESAGYSVAHVADKLARHPITIERWERGKHTPPRACIVALAGLYGVTVSELVD